MKMIFRYAAALSTLVLAASCQLTDPTEVESPDVDIVPEKTMSTISVVASAANESTKTSISYDSENKQFNFHWKAGDKIQLLEFVYENAEYEYGSSDDKKEEGVIESKGGDESTFNSARLMGHSSISLPLAEDTDIASFQVSFSEHEKPEGATYKYVGLYGGNMIGYSWNGQYPVIGTLLDNYQYPTADSFDPSVDMLVSKIVEQENRPESLSLQFARVGGIIKLNLSGLDPGAQISEVILSNDEGFVTAYMMQYDPVMQVTVLDGENKPTNSITCVYSKSPLVADGEGNATVWMRCVAGDIKQWFQVIATVGDEKSKSDCYMAKFADVGRAGKTISFRDGKLTEINVALSPRDVAAPTDVEARCIGGETILVTWSPVENAGGYECYDMVPNGLTYNIERLSVELDPKSGRYIASKQGATSGIHYIKVVSLGSDGHGAYNEQDDPIRVNVSSNEVDVTTGDVVIDGLTVDFLGSVSFSETPLDYSGFFYFSKTSSTLSELTGYSTPYIDGTVDGLNWTASTSSTAYKLTYNTTYYYVAGVNIDGFIYYGDIKTFTTGDVPTPAMVDLGLPSGTKWASFNIGASKESETGYYFSWGETSPKDYYYNNNYKYGWRDALTKYCMSARAGAVDWKNVLEAEDDAATVMLGSEWRMPSRLELEELLANTEKTEDTVNGVSGFRLTSKINGYTDKSIFLPYSGYMDYNDTKFESSDKEQVYLWTNQLTYDLQFLFQPSSYYTNFNAYYLNLYENGYDIIPGGMSNVDTYLKVIRYKGLAVRAVSGGAGRTNPLFKCSYGEAYDITSTSAKVKFKVINVPILDESDRVLYYTARAFTSTDAEYWTNETSVNMRNPGTVEGGATEFCDEVILSMTGLTPGKTYYFNCGYTANPGEYKSNGSYRIGATYKFTTPAE